jgi:outer membrane immunogenic protein
LDKRLVPLLASSAFFAWPAMAQNAVPTFDWTGFYVGLIGGYGWDDFDVESSGQIGPDPIPYDDFSVDAHGGFLGGQVGFDKQIGSWVFGVVGDWSGSDIEGDGATSLYFEDDFVIGEFGASGQINWFASIRGKAGYAFERIMVYGTAGIVFGETETEFWYDFVNPVFEPSVDGSETHTGYALGLGVATMLTPNLMAEVGYLFMDLGSQSYSLTSEDDLNVGQGEIDFSSHLLRFGISYKF